MLSRILEFKVVLSHVAIEYKDCVALNQIDYETIQFVNDILSPFEKMTKKLSDRNETISSVLPCYFSMMHHLERSDEALVQNPELRITFKNAILNGLKNRMSPFLNEKYVLIDF